MGFIEEIKETNENLHNYTLQNITKIIPDLDNIKNVFNEYTDHSSEHSKNVLGLGYLLNNNSHKLNDFEKAIFIIAAYFHDIGMNVKEDEISKYKNKISKEINKDFFAKEFSIKHQIDTENLSDEKMRHFMALDHFRILHAELSEEYIKRKFPKTDKESNFENNYLWHYIGVICRGHTLSYHEILNNNIDYTSINYLTDGTNIDVLYLTLLLRMADICHFSYDRALPFIYVNKDFESQYSKNIWSYHSDIVRVVTDEAESTIKVQADCNNFIHHREIIKHSNYIQEELFNSHKLLNIKKSKKSFKWKYIDQSLVRNISPTAYIFEESKYRLDSKKIITLLMGEKLYSDKLYSIRECIQNAIDAITVCKKKIPMNHYILIDFKEDSKTLDIYDSGTGMNIEIFKNNYLSLGTRSFWKSWQGIKDWGIEQKNISLIAEHGIGNISYFMISEKIEIFSKYHKSQEPIHVMIEDYNDYVEFKPTKLTNFPSFNDMDSYANPWDIGHGTCVRFHLGNKINFTELCKFLSENILRINTDLILSNQENHILPNIWFLKNSDDSRLVPNDLKPFRYIDREPYSNDYNNMSEDFVIKDLFTPNEYYVGNPKDKALQENNIETQNFRGRININFGEMRTIPCRISQNGILIKNAAEFIYKYKNEDDELLFQQYGIDIDVFNKYCFQLDAERTNIIDCEYNEKIITQILPECYSTYLELIPKIESSIYFPCGGSYYHGIEDILIEENASICFHEQFVRHFDYDFLDKNPKIKNSLKDSKLYLTGVERNTPVSVKDISSKDEPRLLVINSERKINKKFIKKIMSEVDENTIFYPDIKTPFLLPLFDSFKLRRFKDFPEFTFYSLIKENDPDNFKTLLEIENLTHQEYVKKE